MVVMLFNFDIADAVDALLRFGWELGIVHMAGKWQKIKGMETKSDVKNLDKWSVLWCHELAFKLKIPFQIVHIFQDVVKTNLEKSALLWCHALAFQLKTPLQVVSYF